MKCEHVGENTAMLCQKHAMSFSDGFPNYEDAKMSESEDVFGLDLLTGNELKYENDKEVIALCKNKENLYDWIDAVSKKAYFFSGYKKVLNIKVLHYAVTLHKISQSHKHKKVERNSSNFYKSR